MPIETIIIIASTIGTAVWSVVTWADQQEKAREEVDSNLDAIYINPFLRVAQMLQGRLYRILAENEIEYLRSGIAHKGDIVGEISYHEALEIVFIMVKYFGWSSVFFQYGSYTDDRKAIELTTTISDLFADRNTFGDDPFSFTHSRQQSLGQRFVTRIIASHTAFPEFRAATVYQFEKEVNESKEQSTQLYLDLYRTIEDIRQAQTSKTLEGRARLVEIHNTLVDLINYIEVKEGFTLSREPRKKLQLVSDEIVSYKSNVSAEQSFFEQWLPISPFLDNLAEVVQPEQSSIDPSILHVTEGRIRLKVPSLNYNPEHAQLIQSSIQALQGVKSIEIRPQASSLIVYFDKTIPKVLFERDLLVCLASDRCLN